MNDFKFAFRQLLKNPGFTAVAVLTLALGIGANTAIFGVLNELLLRPLPVKEPGQLLGVVLANDTGDFANQSIPYPIVQDYREQMDSIFDQFAAYASTHSLADSGSGPQFTMLELVTVGYFSTLGVEPAIGRFFGEADDRLSNEGAVAVISHGAWRGWFNSEPSVIGQIVTLRPAYAEPVHATIVGVAPEGFNGIERTAAQVWLPAVLEKHFKDAAPVNFRMIGRLADGVSRRQAEAALDVVAASVATGRGGRVIPGYVNEGIFRSDLRTELRHAALGSWGAFRSYAPLRRARLLSFGVAALVLLIACANIANLTLARAERRRRDTAIRLSLGASRGRVLRAALAESLLLALFGGIAGLALALAGNRLLFALRPSDVELLVRTNLDLRVAGFCFAAALISGLLVGLLPAWRSSRENPNRALKEHGGQSHGRGVHVRDAFATTQIALSMILLVGAGLCLRSLAGLLNANPGFRADQLIVASLHFEKVPEGGGAAHYRTLAVRLSSLPGVESVSWSSVFPLVPMGGGISAPVDRIEGYEPKPNEFLIVEFTEVAPGFFEALGMARATTPDRSLAGAGTLAWANEAFVQRYWPGQNPIGRRVGNWQIDGVVKDVRIKNLWDPATPYLYIQKAEANAASGVFFIRTRAEPAAMLDQVRVALLAVDPDLNLSRLTTMREALNQTLHAQRFMVVLLGVFAGCAVLLALIGIYGVISYLVSQRTREIGIRMALGAERRNIMAGVLRRGGWLTAAGLALGLFGSWGATRLLRSVVHEVSPTDPVTFITVTWALAAAALLACWLPARRAAKIDPMVALRIE
jgi:putative ABC transport system permease protein